MIYLDTCALVKLIRNEPESDALRTYIDIHGPAVITCELAMTELPRAIQRINHDNQRRLQVKRAVLESELAAADYLLRNISMVLLDAGLLQRAGAWDQDPHLGSLDAIHLKAASEFMPSLTSFLTYDRRLLSAVKAAGLPAESPT